MAPATVVFVDSDSAVCQLVSEITDLPNDPPSLYLDLEGVNLSRDGSISLITIFALPKNQVYLLDIHTMNNSAFTTPGKAGNTLKDILESKYVEKAFFDVRNDSDALFAHFGVKLEGVQDIQLMENASRPSSREFLSSLDKCISRDAPLSFQEKKSWSAVKARGANLFDPRKGGTYEVFNQRPLSDEIGQYCVNDVQFFASASWHLLPPP